MVVEDLDFIKGLSVTDWWSLFADASRNFFRVGSLVFIMATCQDDVMRFDKLLKERDKPRERRETLKQQSSNFENELAEFGRMLRLLALCRKSWVGTPDRPFWFL